MTISTLDRIDLVLAAIVTETALEIWELGHDDFIKGMIDSRGKNAKGRVSSVQGLRPQAWQIVQAAPPARDMTA